MSSNRIFCFLALSLSLSSNIMAAGLGFNPFQKASPTSPTNLQNERPVGPSTVPAPKPPPSSLVQPKPATTPTQNQNNQQQKK